MHLGKVREIKCILGARLFFEVLSLADDLDGVYHGLHKMCVILLWAIMRNVPKAGVHVEEQTNIGVYRGISSGLLLNADVNHLSVLRQHFGLIFPLVVMLTNHLI